MGSLWNRSGMVERYADDIRAAGAQAFFYNGGTTTPLTVFQDSGEAAAHPFPVVADANGRWPDVFVPYIVSYDVQVKTAANVQLTYSLEIPNPDPVELTVTIPAQEKIQTGMIVGELVNGTRAGFVRLNGRTIGNGSSAGTERANADTSDLFTYLWNGLTDAVAPVSGGRGGSAAADYLANKTITLPSWQGAGPIGLDDMGATAGSFFSGLTFGVGNATTAGSLTGINGVTLDSTNMPAHTHAGTTSNEGFTLTNKATGTQSVDHTHSGTTNTTGSGHNHTVTDTGHTHTVSQNANSQNTAAVVTAGGIGIPAPAAATITINSNTTGVTVASTDGTHTHTFTTGGISVGHTHNFSITVADSLHNHTFTTDSKGGLLGVTQSFNNLGRSRLVTWFIKL